MIRTPALSKTATPNGATRDSQPVVESRPKTSPANKRINLRTSTLLVVARASNLSWEHPAGSLGSARATPWQSTLDTGAESPVAIPRSALVTAIPRGQRLQVFVPVFSGIALGGFLWILWLGPLVLP